MLLQSPLKHKLSRGLRFTGSEQCEKAKRLKHNFGLLKIHLHQATPMSLYTTHSISLRSA